MASCSVTWFNRLTTAHTHLKRHTHTQHVKHRLYYQNITGVVSIFYSYDTSSDKTSGNLCAFKNLNFLVYEFTFRNTYYLKKD